MRNLTFMLWVLLWPLSCQAGDYLSSLHAKKTFSDHVESAADLTLLGIWIFVAWLLYEK